MFIDLPCFVFGTETNEIQVSIYRPALEDEKHGEHADERPAEPRPPSSFAMSFKSRTELFINKRV